MPGKLYAVVCGRANARTKQYMQTLLQETFPKTQIKALEDIPSTVQEVILLYSDAIGLGFTPLEKSSQKRFQKISILNGRGRIFVLTSSVSRRLRLRRFFEKTFLIELILGPILLIFGCILCIKDFFAGRS